jgi:Protein of unknown function (DUF3572)
MRPSRGTPDAEAIAVKALGFLAGDPERLGAFLGLTGLGPENLRAAAREPGFLASVLDHVASDESLMLAFAGQAGLAPETVARAHRMLSGPPAASD